jgi:hypothetical protein
MSLNNIPNNWSGGQALAIYDFFGQIQQPIWYRHELQFIDLLGADLNEMDTHQIDLFELNDNDPIPFSSVVMQPIQQFPGSYQVFAIDPRFCSTVNLRVNRSDRHRLLHL